MRTNIKLMSVVVIIMMFFTIATGGCGGGSSGSSSDYNMGNKTRWDTDPDDRNQNNNGNNNQDNNNGNNNNQNNNGGDNNNNGNGNQNNNNGSLVAINGTWEIVSGSGVQYIQVSSGNTTVSNLTCIPEKNSKVGIDMSKSDYFGASLGYFSTTLTGDNVTAGGLKGNGILAVFCTVEGYPSSEATMLFPGGFAYEYIGDGTYRMTDETYDKAVGVKANSGYYENTLKLENASTLKWTYWYRVSELVTANSTVDYQYEIVLKKVQ